ncbi:MAG: hypothetical protein EOO40_11930, partial [Deltaproteobacteria bacterium]
PGLATHASMPAHAYASGGADRRLSPEAIADALMSLAGPGPALSAAAQTEGEPLERLFKLFEANFRISVQDYKLGTIERRVKRRMYMHRIDTLERYLQFCLQSPRELSDAYQDLFVSVTHFFRDKAPFERIATTVIPQLLAKKSPGEPIRIWVPGCASGEEAYSLSMLWLDALKERAYQNPLHIFGTDIDAHCLGVARLGIYSANLLNNVGAERLAKYFIKRPGSSQISRAVRDTVIFSTHDVLHDAPFSNLDMISCRNLLIYLKTPAQSRVLKAFHYALRPSGSLLLGISESIGDHTDLFAQASPCSKLFGRKQSVISRLEESEFAPPAAKATEHRSAALVSAPAEAAQQPSRP